MPLIPSGRQSPGSADQPAGKAPVWDALTTALSRAAPHLLSRRHLYLWIAVDLVYSPLYLAARLPGLPSAEVETIARERRYALILLPDTDIPFVQDGTCDARRRETMHRWFLDELTARDEPFTLVSGPPNARLRAAIAAV